MLDLPQSGKALHCLSLCMQKEVFVHHHTHPTRFSHKGRSLLLLPL